MNKPQGQSDNWIYLAALMAILPMAIVCVTDKEDFEEGDIGLSEVYIPSLYGNPEKELLKKENSDLLSQDAKFVIDLVCGNQYEEEVYGKRRNRNPTNLKLRKVLQGQFKWSNLRQNRTFKELKEYVKYL
jgi:hypothetical protein